MRLLLSSKGLANEELISNYLSFVESKRKVSIVTTASKEYKEKNRNTIKLNSQLIDLGFSVKLVDVEFDNPEILKNSDTIIIGGGNPYYLLHQIKRSNSEKLILELISNEIPIWGISAGFMILMKDLGIIDLLTPEMNNIDLKEKECLGILDEIVIPHYDRFIKEGKIYKEDVDKFEIESKSRIIRLGEFQCLNYIDNKIEKIGEANTDYT